MDLNKISFSVCMSVYRNDNPNDFKQAVHSIYTDQTVKPNEIILVVDGPINKELKDTVRLLELEIEILRVISLRENMGHAIARQTGLEAASNKLVAVMDADDIAIPTRFEQQLRAFNEHPEVSVIGGVINEFMGIPDNIVGTRVCPESDEDIKAYLKSRCPMNLVTVMLKKSDIQAVGGYQDWYCEEDYYLWIRLTLGGYKFYNLQNNLVNVRVSEEMYQRRGGIRYFKSERLLQKYMLTHKIIKLPKYIYNVLIRFVLQVLMPNSLRGWIFQKFARS